MAAEVQHHRLEIGALTLHYVTAGETGPPLILLHGFPQTWWQWRKIIDRLSGRFRILAPDLRGIGALPGPMTGYDKITMANDIGALAETVFGHEPVYLCGHDVGAFVSFAYALKFRDGLRGLVLVDAPPPGTSPLAAITADPRSWHVGFHGQADAQTDVAVMLVTGRERQYLSHFYNRRIYDAGAITQQDIDIYAAAYSAPGALRAGFEWYRAFAQDHEDNIGLLASGGKISVPVVGVGGGAGMAGPFLRKALDEVAINTRTFVFERCGHWVSEEQPDALASILIRLSEGAFDEPEADIK